MVFNGWTGGFSSSPADFSGFYLLIPGSVLSSTDQSDQARGKEEKICGDGWVEGAFEK